MNWDYGDLVDAVGQEHGFKGRRMPATVKAVTEVYVIVTYDKDGKTDMYWRSSGWRAWDGEKSWRLEPRREVRA